MAKLTVAPDRKSKLQSIVSSDEIKSPTLKRVLTSYLNMADGTTFKTTEAARLAKAGLIESLWKAHQSYGFTLGDYDVYYTFALIYSHALRVNK